MAPRVHFVKKARKDNPRAGVKKGESYFWWANRPPGRKSGIKRFSKTRPRPSQVEGNPYYSAAYAIQEGLEDSLAACSTLEDLEAFAADVTNASEEARSLGDEQEEKLNNMPDGLQQSSTGELLQERTDNCGSVADALETLASEIEGKPWEEQTDEEMNAGDDADPTFDKAKECVESLVADISWDW